MERAEFTFGKTLGAGQEEGHSEQRRKCEQRNRGRRERPRSGSKEAPWCPVLGVSRVAGGCSSCRVQGGWLGFILSGEHVKAFGLGMTDISEQVTRKKVSAPV